MAQTKVTDDVREVTEVDAAKITTGTIPEARITSLAASKLTGTVDNARISLDAAEIPNLDTAKITSGTFADARISEASVTQHVTAFDPSVLEYNQAILAFKIASANQLAKFSMVDQVIDEYQDATGIDASASTNELAGGATTAKYFEGGTSTAVTTSSVGSVASTGTVDGDYTYYKWTTTQSDGTFTTNVAQDYEYLVVAGGGAGGDSNSNSGAGGGAGGFRTATGFAVAATTITGITVGAGGVAGTNVVGPSGGDSVFSTITSAGGGGGGAQSVSVAGIAGGSGGGGSYDSGAGGAGNTPSTDPVQGYAGGSSIAGPNAGGGGGGGAGGVGENGLQENPATDAMAGDGGVGVASSITGASVYYAGGGAGEAYTRAASGGNGGGGASAVTGTANTGGGGGGGSDGGTNRTAGSGGSGIVVIRRLTSVLSSGGNLTLQSVATTAESAPTKADLVVLIEDGSGTATVNTDVKGYISRNGSAFSTAVTFADEGDWGTNKRILVARQVDISGITSGTSMKYKLTTHNQSAGSKETRIHATSLAWS